MHIFHYCLGPLLLGFLVKAPSSLAFVPNAPQLIPSSHNSAVMKRASEMNSFTSSLFATAPEGNSSDGEKKSDFDVEAARQRLESMMGNGAGSKTSESSADTSSSSSSSSSPLQYFDDLLSPSSTETEKDIELPPPPPLSTIERDRRNAEIQLLKGLDVTNEASSELWTLWYSERGATAKKKLEAADKLMGNPKSWNMSEQSLRELIDEYGVYFVEPLNRLATLYFLQNKFDESYKVCLLILQVKPWHFGALAGIVQVCIGRGDIDGARHWATKRLPNLLLAEGGPDSPRRKEWVEKQVLAAEKQLAKVERETIRSFGKPDSYTTTTKGESSGSAEEENFESGIQEFDDGGDAWL